MSILYIQFVDNISYSSQPLSHIIIAVLNVFSVAYSLVGN